MQVQPFKNYLQEATGDKKFLRLLIITDEPEMQKNFHTADRLQEECKKLGYPLIIYLNLQVVIPLMKTVFVSFITKMIKKVLKLVL